MLSPLEYLHRFAKSRYEGEREKLTGHTVPPQLEMEEAFVR